MNQNFTEDSTIRQIEDVLRSWVKPRISGVNFAVVALSGGNHALVVRIPRSFASPHMLDHNGLTQFLGRNAKGKYPLDVSELRSAFLGSAGLEDRLKNFRIDRVSRLTSGQTPVPLKGQHLIVLHILPVASARPDVQFATSVVRDAISKANRVEKKSFSSF